MAIGEKIKDLCGKAARWLRQPRHMLHGVSLVLAVYFIFMAGALVTHMDAGGIALLCLLAFIVLRAIHMLSFSKVNAPTIASGFFERRKIAELLKKHMAARPAQGAYTIVDLGSGRGELTRHIARALPAARVIGVELSYLPYRQSVFMQKLLNFRNLEYRRGDFMAHDCADADAVIMFLSGNLTKAVGDKLCGELRPGALVIASEFELLGDWQSVETLVFHTPFRAVLFVYEKGLD